MVKTVKKILFFLTHSERKKLPLLLAMILIMALLEMIGVASIIPFITVLSNPSLIETNVFLNIMFEASGIFGVENSQEFIYILGVLVFCILVFSILFKALTTYAISRFVHMREYSISKLLVTRYLHQPYSWFLNRNSADLGKSILSEVGILIGSGIKPMMTLIVYSMVALMLLGLLIFVNVKVALSVFLTFGIAYGLIYKFFRGFINRIGQERLKANQLRFTSISEGFGAVKEVKVSGLEESYIKKFAEPAEKLARHHASFVFVNQLPRFALEALAFGGMMLMILYLMAQTGNFINALPTITLYALAGYRLMPALQQVYASVTQLRFLGPGLDSLYYDVKNLKTSETQFDQSVIPLNKKITLKHINYNYPNTSRVALKDISIDIPVKKIVGLVGTTGSGKTTTVDIILGLLEAQQGTLEVDGKVINKKNCRAWQKSIGYVPQAIYLADDTITANIAFGVDPENINQKSVENAAKTANLHEFIINELPNQYQTTTGERGVRLSGGQRQRIGIARALYHKPKVLILDEATSALDNITEHAVMEAVNSIGGDMTIILIAHRLSTVKKCDIIYLLENGKVKNKGTFEELIKANNDFQVSVNK